MSRGLKPRSFRDHRRYDFHRTFKDLVQRRLGAVGGSILDFVLPIYSNPDQNVADPYWPREALPEGCTGFAQAHIAEADLGQPVDPQDIYENTAIISGKPGQPQTLEDSFKAATLYGVKTKGQTDQQALAHRLAPRFEVRPQPGMEWYDAILQACFANRHPVSAGTTWPPEYEMVASDGLQHFSAMYWVGGHDHCFIGKKTIAGEERLVDISWNGPQWGDGGLSYFNRQQVNAMMSVVGSDALTSRVLSGEEVKTVWLTMLLKFQIIELLVSLYQRLIKATLARPQTPPAPPNTPVVATSTPPVPVVPPTVPKTVPESDLTALRPWTTQKNYFHNVGVLCDRVGLSYDQKTTVRGCIWIESRFRDYDAHGLPVKNPNKDKTGAVWSTDWGLVQINDWPKFKHIGPGCMFSSVEDVLSHPQRAAQYMIDTMKATGRLDPWASYTSGEYKEAIVPTSPMWSLKS